MFNKRAPALPELQLDIGAPRFSKEFPLISVLLPRALRNGLLGHPPDDATSRTWESYSEALSLVIAGKRGLTVSFLTEIHAGLNVSPSQMLDGVISLRVLEMNPDKVFQALRLRVAELAPRQAAPTLDDEIGASELAHQVDDGKNDSARRECAEQLSEECIRVIELLSATSESRQTFIELAAYFRRLSLVY